MSLFAMHEENKRNKCWLPNLNIADIWGQLTVVQWDPSLEIQSIEPHLLPQPNR